MADPAIAAARAVDQLTDEPLPGLPMTDVDRVEADLLAEDRAVDAPRTGVFRLVTDPGLHPLGSEMVVEHELVVRLYPDLDPPATFVDCWTCRVTWEPGR